MHYVLKDDVIFPFGCTTSISHGKPTVTIIAWVCKMNNHKVAYDMSYMDLQAHS